MGRTRAKHSRSDRSGEGETVKLGAFIDPADLELLAIASEASGMEFDMVLSLALSWGCERLRDACPFQLPPEALATAPRPLWAN